MADLVEWSISLLYNSLNDNNIFLVLEVYTTSRLRNEYCYAMKQDARQQSRFLFRCVYYSHMIEN